MEDLKIGKPLTLRCGLTLPNRLVKAAMTEQMADGDQLPDEKLNHAYGQWADGGWGLVLTGNVQVDVQYLGQAYDTALNETIPRDKLLNAWKSWAAACNRSGTPTLMQLNHPGRQSAIGAGRRGYLAKSLAPSAVPLQIGPGVVQRFFSWLVFGTPKEMTSDDIKEAIRQFAAAARLAYDAGFAGIELHAAHGYLLAQFLSSTVNHRSDSYGGSPVARAKLIVDIVAAIRAEVPSTFCVGVKLNSVDHQSASELSDCIEQLHAIAAAGVDFIEISGGSYENPVVRIDLDQPPTILLLSRGRMLDALAHMILGKKEPEKSNRTKAREAFFLDFAKAIRSEFPDVPLMVTGGFRTRQGMEAAVAEGHCDLIGIARPACLDPALPKSTVFNPELAAEDANVYARRIEPPWILKRIAGFGVGAGIETTWYSKQIQRLGES